MAKVHARIGGLLARIELPDYVYSQKGRSYTDNAHQHVGAHPVIKTDIHRFYPSTTRAMVASMFLRDFECAADIAYRLADICCYRQEHLPTGSPLSGRIAFFAARQMFNEVAAVAVAAGAECKPTVHVDGITVSGFGATTSLLGEVRKAVHGHGLKTKQRKSKTYAAGSPKPVTGAVIVGAELRLPNERHRKIWQTRQDLLRAQGPERVRVQRVLRGRLQEAKQILGREALQVGVGVGAGDGSEIKRAAFLDHQATEA